MKFQNILQSALVMPVMIATVHAEETSQKFLTAAQARAIFFPKGTSFMQTTVNLSSEQCKAIQALSNMKQREKNPQVWKAQRGNVFAGWFIVDQVIGKHEFITYGTAISQDGKVLGVEILDYRETHGGEVQRMDWRKNFLGKNLSNPPVLNQNVPNISGATLSSRNVTDGVRRLLALQKVALNP